MHFSVSFSLSFIFVCIHLCIYVYIYTQTHMYIYIYILICLTLFFSLFLITLPFYYCYKWDHETFLLIHILIVICYINASFSARSQVLQINFLIQFKNAFLLMDDSRSFSFINMTYMFILSYVIIFFIMFSVL